MFAQVDMGLSSMDTPLFAITSLLPSQFRLTSLHRIKPIAETLVCTPRITEQGKDDPCQLICHRHHNDIGGLLSREQAFHPARMPLWLATAPTHDRSGTMHKQPLKVATTSFRDPPH